jgi:hypothetical protein
MQNQKHHLIFEGAELVGKSFLISQIYDYLEKKYNTNKTILNGCHWINADVGIFGTRYGKKVIKNYVCILKTLKNENVIFEKFYLSDLVYNKLYNNKNINYKYTERKLKKLNTKIILIVVKDKKVFSERINDRLKNTPHYERILQKAENYWEQQNEYIKLVKKSGLESLVIDFSTPLDQKFVKKQVNKILEFIGEK